MVLLIAHWSFRCPFHVNWPLYVKIKERSRKLKYKTNHFLNFQQKKNAISVLINHRSCYGRSFCFRSSWPRGSHPTRGTRMYNVLARYFYAHYFDASFEYTGAPRGQNWFGKSTPVLKTFFSWSMTFFFSESHMSETHPRWVRPQAAETIATKDVSFAREGVHLTPNVHVPPNDRRKKNDWTWIPVVRSWRLWVQPNCRYIRLHFVCVWPFWHFNEKKPRGHFMPCRRVLGENQENIARKQGSPRLPLQIFSTTLSSQHIASTCVGEWSIRAFVGTHVQDGGIFLGQITFRFCLAELAYSSFEKKNWSLRCIWLFSNVLKDIRVISFPV